MGKKLAFVAFSDIHFGDYKEFNNNGIRIHAHLQVLKYLDNLAFENKVPLLFAGDFFNNPNNISNRLLRIVFPYLIKGLKSRMIGIDGNHDQDSASSFRDIPDSYFHTLSLLNDKITCVNLKSVLINDYGDLTKDYIIHGIPYISYNIGFLEYIEKLSQTLDKSKKNILLIHTDLPDAEDTNGSKSSSVKGVSKEFYRLFKKFDLVLSGHIHKFQKLSSNCYMIGAPQQQRRTDMNCQMGFVKIYDDLSVEFQEIEFTPKFINITEENEKLNHKPNDFFTLIKKPNPRENKTSNGEKVEKTKNLKNIITDYCQNEKVSKIRKVKLLKLLKQNKND